MFTATEAYDRHVGRYSRQLGRKLMAAADVRPGQSALDIGCGPGALTAELVALLGAQNVAAAEPSEPFAQACAQRDRRRRQDRRRRGSCRSPTTRSTSRCPSSS